MRGSIATAVLVLGFCAPASRAELVYFTGGGEAHVPATSDGAKVRIDVAGRSFEFLKSDFRLIVPGFSPEREWDARRTKALAGGPVARYTAAWWALENGLTPQAESMLREAHRADPQHQPTARMVAALDRLARPCGEPDLAPLRRALGSAFELARGPHVVLLHQHGDDEAKERVDLLERVTVAFYLLLSSHGIDLPAPAERMPSALFAQKADYVAYLESEGLGVFRSTRGYFHPTLGCVMAYDGRGSGSQKTTRDALIARRGELQAMDETIDRMPPRSRLLFQVRGEPTASLNRAEARARLDDLRRDLRRGELLAELDWRAVDLGTAAHEMVHQLVAVAGLAPHHDDFPLWLHEGFAAQFEVIRGGRWAGVGRAHDLRLPDWRSIRPEPQLAPLVEGSGFGHGYQRDSYAKAWALVYFLRKEQPQQFLTFLDLLRAPGADNPRPRDRSTQTFLTAFGDVDALQDAWRQYLATLKTPLEEHRPGSPKRPALSPLRD